MKKTLYTFLFFIFSLKIFSQGAPACPSIQTTGGSVCRGLCVPLTASVVTNNQTTSYNVSSIPYNPYPCTGTGTGVSVGTDDVWSPVVTLPFSFCYFGTAYTQCIIGSNGQISFNLTNAGGVDGWSISTPMPNSIDMPPNTICGVFRDIDPALGGSVYYNIVGASPCRALVVCFDNIPLFDNTGVGATTCGGTPNSSFQMVLYETTNYIDVYVGNSFSCSGWNGGYGEIGIQNAGPTVAVTAPGWNNPSTPTGNNVAFRFSPSGAPSYTVTWSDPTGVVGTGLNFNACPSSTTTYTASMTLTNCNGSTMTLTDTAIVTIVPSGSMTVNSPTICAGSTATLTATGGTTYTWSTGSTANPITVSPATTTVYTVSSGSGGGGCIPMATSTVTVVPALTVTVNSPPAICSGTSTNLNASGAATYTWTPPTGLSGVNGATVTANPNTTTTYTVTGSSGSCPPASAVTTVTIIPSTTITINSGTICPTSNATLTATGSSTYSWSPGTGLSSTSGASVVANPPSTTVYTVTGANCVTAGTCTVTVVPMCSISVNSATICPNASATLTANGGGPYTWSPPTGLSSTSGASVVANPAATTVYTVTSSSGGFSVTATSTVLVNPQPNLSVSSITICQGSPGNMTATGNVVNYVWNPTTGLSSATASNVVASPSVTTVYTVTGTDANSCTVTAVGIVGVNPLPTASVTPLTAAGCAPLAVSFAGTSSTTSQSCDWNFGNGNTGAGCNTSYSFNAGGTYVVTFTVTDMNGCKGTATSTVTVYPVPKADFLATPQPTSILESNIQFLDYTSQAQVATWHWDFGVTTDTYDTSNIKNPKWFYQDTGTYSVELWVTTAKGCKDSTIRIIHIEDDFELYVPNAFSPNADGINDVFLPKGMGIVTESYNLYIYDRWGNMVFHTTDLYKGWDGTRRAYSDTMQEDVYVWKIFLKTTQGTKKQMSGHVSLLK